MSPPPRPDPAPSCHLSAAGNTFGVTVRNNLTRPLGEDGLEHVNEFDNTFVTNFHSHGESPATHRSGA